MAPKPRRQNAPRPRLARALGPLLVVLGFAILYAGYMQVKLKRGAAAAREEWATLENALNERSQLALRLVAVVRDRAPQAPDPNENPDDDPDPLDAILDDVERAANQLGQSGSPTDRANADVALGVELGRLLGAVRETTALRDDDEYQKELGALADATTAVSSARARYNEIVLKENKVVDGIPGKLIAPLFKIEPLEYFNAFVKEDADPNSGGAAKPDPPGATTSVEPLPPASEN